MKLYLTKLVTLLALHGWSGSIAWAQSSGTKDQQLLQAGFSTCDARILGVAWQSSTEDMKDWILNKVQYGLTQTVHESLPSARMTARLKGALKCGYVEAGFSYRDVETLAGAWNTNSWEAKMRIGWAAARGHRDSLVADLKAALTGSTSQLELAAFKSSRFIQCDATLLARMWGETVIQNKEFIGMKVKAGSANSVDHYLNAARDKVARGYIQKCDWVDVPYTYDDAELLAKSWSMETWEAKTQIAEKLTWGNASTIDTLLARLRKKR